MWTVVHMLKWATDYFKKKDIPSPRLSIEWLLSHLLGVHRLDLYLQFDRPLSPDELNRLKPLIMRRAKNEPLQYITGTTDFLNLTLRVTKDVLIPRPETEQLVEKLLQQHPGNETLRFLDIGTGSGCIALAIKKARPQWQVTAIDISDHALLIARDNAHNLKLDISFHHTGFQQFHPEKTFDIVASNPPYIGIDEISSLEKQVIDFEPRTALILDDVTTIYSELVDWCKSYLSPTGKFYLEINEKYGDKLLKICNLHPFKGILSQDYSAKDRFLTGFFDK
ncbi:MAG: peptide chain release factor N(5)-glutamine methyltransferase [Balneolales bacterium]